MALRCLVVWGVRLLGMAVQEAWSGCAGSVGNAGVAVHQGSKMWLCRKHKVAVQSVRKCGVAVHQGLGARKSGLCLVTTVSRGCWVLGVLQQWGTFVGEA